MKRFGWFFVILSVLVTALPFAAAKSIGSGRVTVSVMISGEVLDMDIEEYTLRVLIAEGNGCESPEAKKALAVAVRSCGTYFALYRLKHENFDACSDKSCCLPLGDPKKANGSYLAALNDAVSSTKGEILTLEGLPAIALFTLCASEGTRFCAEFPYLSAVSNGKKCERHISECEFAPEELGISESGDDFCIVYCENRKCEFAILENKKISADELIKKYSLPSYEFELEINENEAKFTCYGAGNGCGLDLCGADSTAQSGSDYKKILLTYYPNLELNKIYNT